MRASALRTLSSGAAFFIFAGFLAAAENQTTRISVLRRAAGAYSVELPLVTRVLPSAATSNNSFSLTLAQRFTVTLSARDPRTGGSGFGQAVPQNDIFGYFSIPALTFNPNNPEVFVKILDGRSLNGAYWVFYGGLTDLEYTLTVAEISTGRVRTYTKPAGGKCGDFDTSAFPQPAAGQAQDASALLPAVAFSPSQLVRTAVDFNNNTSKNGVTVTFQYSYRCLAGACTPGFYRTLPHQITLQAIDGFHQDDFVGYLASLGLLVPGADQGAAGTLLVTVSNLAQASPMGWEVGVSAQTYSQIMETDPSQGTVGFGYSASLFFESADRTLVGGARDTRGATEPSPLGALRSDIGIRNTDINGTGQNMTIDLSFYDPGTGGRVGDLVTLSSVQPGELRQIDDLWSTARIPNSVSSVLVFADARNPTSTSPTMEGYILLVDTQRSNSARYFELKCADANGCGN